MSGREIDLANLDSEELEKVVNAIHIVSQYELEKKDVAESIKETLENLVEELNADKDSKAEVKKIVRKAAGIYAKQKTFEVSHENRLVELMLEKIENASVQPEE